MALNPSYYQTAPPVSVGSAVLYQEHIFHLYGQQYFGVTEYNLVKEINSENNYGRTNVFDWAIPDGPDPNTAKVVARLQGLSMNCDTSGNRNCYTCSNMIFTDLSFKGSTISVQGAMRSDDWAIVGGTGQFARAQGTLSCKWIQTGDKGIIEFQIRFACLTFPKPGPVQKVGPWGGNGGTPYEILQPDQLPQRLQSITIYGTSGVITSIEFAYVDQAGQNQKVTVGKTSTAGAVAVGSYSYKPVPLGPTEVVQELYGATGDNGGQTVVTELTIVTNRTTYGPYGRQHWGNTPFHVAAPNGQSIVGFYGRGDGQVVNQIGAYVAPNN
ncbi:unnamed protein product [Urochloa humidicola]